MSLTCGRNLRRHACRADWIDALETWALPDNPAGLRELDLLKVRSRDVLEHIERVVHHVRRLEQSTETAVQMHFSAQSNRTNDIMRTLTALTAVFLPLNLIAGIFGMNFEFAIDSQANASVGAGSMGFHRLALVLLFWRNAIWRVRATVSSRITTPPTARELATQRTRRGMASPGIPSAANPSPGLPGTKAHFGPGESLTGSTKLCKEQVSRQFSAQIPGLTHERRRGRPQSIAIAA